MAKAMIACFRQPLTYDPTPQLKAIAKRMAPDNARAAEPYIQKNQNTFCLIYNPSPTIRKNGLSFCLGLSEPTETLFQPEAPLPDGSYALFRANEDLIEVSSDFAASRTLWYYMDGETFVAATSQRMIIALLGDLDFNEEACGWFLCSGNPGPGVAWDKRLQFVAPRTQLLLDQKNWSLSVNKDEDFNFETKSNTEKTFSEYKKGLEEAVKNSVDILRIDPSQWTLALSGGMDSRSLLYHLQDPKLKAVTWGLQKALEEPLSDAVIGRSLAQKCNMEHSYAAMDYRTGSFDKILTRFLFAGEGKIDHLAAYMDSLELWGDLSASGRGVVRGYDAFGRKPPVSNPYHVRRACNMTTSLDYPGTSFPENLIVSTENIPEHLRQRAEESLGDWRDRLWLQHRTPIVTAALEDIKLSYVEVINPLLSKEVVRSVQSLPLDLRTNKKVWKSIVMEMFPGVPLARREAIPEVSRILNLPDVKDYICSSLLAHRDNGVIPADFIEGLTENYTKNQRKRSVRRKIRRLIMAYLPKKIENLIRANLNPSSLSNSRLACRTLMVLGMKDILTEDAKLAAQPVVQT